MQSRRGLGPKVGQSRKERESKKTRKQQQRGCLKLRIKWVWRDKRGKGEKGGGSKHEKTAGRA